MRLCFLLMLLMSSFYLSAQNIPLKSLDLILGKDIKVKEKPESTRKYGYDGFYLDSNFNQIYACCENYSSKYSDLVGKVFKVNSFKEYKFNYAKSKAKLVIENTETGILYFDYDAESEDGFPFEVVGGLVFPEGYFCNEISQSIDKFSGKITYSSPVLDQIVVLKVVDADKVNIYMSVNAYGSTISLAKKGVVLLLSDGTKIDKSDEDITVEVSGSGYRYSSFFQLTRQDVERLTNVAVTDVRLYIYDSSIANGEEVKEYIKCLGKS